MKKLLPFFIVMIAFINANSQDVVYTTSAGFGDYVIKIDSLIIENLTTKSSVAIKNTLQSDVLVLNIKSGLLVGLGKEFNLNERKPFEIVQCVPGELSIRSNALINRDITISVHSIAGKCLLNQKLNSNPFEVYTIQFGEAGVYVINFETANIKTTFKAIGKVGNGAIGLAKKDKNATSLKSADISNGNDFRVSVGDNLKFTAFLLEYYSNPIYKVVQMNESLKFEFDDDYTMMRDPRDNRQYKTAEIDTQIWMAENLAYLPSVSPSSAGSETLPYYYVYGYNGTNVENAKASQNYLNYGVLYNWAAAKVSCPAGWHLPSDLEWINLNNSLGGDAIAGGKLKEVGNYHWVGTNNGATNQSGYTALPGGYREVDNTFLSLGLWGVWWNSTDVSKQIARSKYIGNDIKNVVRGQDIKSLGFSVRCVKGESLPLKLPELTTTNPSNVVSTTAITGGNITSKGGSNIISRGVCWNKTGNPTIDDSLTINPGSVGDFLSILYQLTPNTTYYLRAYATNFDGTAYGNETTFKTQETLLITKGSFTDTRDGHSYQTAQIGSKTWMAENLAYLPTVSPPSTRSQTVPSYYVYGYNGINVASAKATQNYSNYGVLYNWHGAMASCPTGWHLPSNDEWTTLVEFLGGAQVAGQKMKEAGSLLWNTPTTSVLATNESGFTGRPGGYLYINGYFQKERTDGFWWTSTVASTSHSKGWFIYFNDSDIKNSDQYSKDHGISVRCVKD